MKARHNFRELNIWKKSMDLVFDIYRLTQKLPDVEKFALVSQVNRSAVSIPSNIAEGTSRISEKEISRFLDIALGSSYELETQLLLIGRLYKENEEHVIELINKINEIQKMMGGFRKKINED
jgi:four helix bundle protein